MRDIDLLEFAIYHWVHKENIKLPGLYKGIPFPEFFINARFNNSDEIEELIFNYLEKEIINWEGFKNPSLILCSGGVDSSLLVAAANKHKSKYKLLHTSYIDHDINDLNKLLNIIQNYPADTNLFSVDSSKYLLGLKFCWENELYQNTYAPTLAYSLLNNGNHFANQLITGSGPDELFYGMEKYNWDYFTSLSKVSVEKALEKIDVAYNLNAYKSILNKMGLDLLAQITSERRVLYKQIAVIYDNIYDAQRLLAYTTVTSQHMHLFNKMAGFFNLHHRSPYLTEDFVKLSFSIPIQKLIHPRSNRNQVEIGKYHLKKFLLRYMPKNHVYSRKIGFHAPTTKFMYSKNIFKLFQNFDYCKLPKFLDIDKTKGLLSKRLNDHNNLEDYFLYSILNLVNSQTK